MAKVGQVGVFDAGNKKVPVLVVADNGNGTYGVFGPVEDGNDVKFLASVPEGEGGVTFKV